VVSRKSNSFHTDPNIANAIDKTASISVQNSDSTSIDLVHTRGRGKGMAVTAEELQAETRMAEGSDMQNTGDSATVSSESSMRGSLDMMKLDPSAVCFTPRKGHH